MEKDQRVSKPKRCISNESKPKKKMRKVNQFLYSSNVNEMIKKQKLDESDKKEIPKTIKRNPFERKRQELKRCRQHLNSLEQLKQSAKKKSTRYKIFNQSLQEWTIFCKIAMITLWRGLIRFYIVDDKGIQVKCQFEKDTTHNEQVKELLKIGNYYHFSKGIATIDKEGNLLLSFTKKSIIIPKQNGHFKLNYHTTFRINQIAHFPLYSRLNVLGIVHRIEKVQSIRYDASKTNNSVFICDPFSKSQIQVKHLVVLDDEYRFAIGDLVILHDMHQLRKQEPICYSQDRRQIAIIQSILIKMMRYSRYKLEQIKYDQIKKLKFNHTTVKKLCEFRTLEQKEQPIFWNLDGHITKIAAGDAEEDITKPEALKVYHLIISLNDDTAKMNFKMGWHLIRCLVDVTLQDYKLLCSRKKDLDSFLRKLGKNRVRLKIKSIENKEGQVQHIVESIESLTKTISAF